MFSIQTLLIIGRGWCEISNNDFGLIVIIDQVGVRRIEKRRINSQKDQKKSFSPHSKKKKTLPSLTTTLSQISTGCIH